MKLKSNDFVRITIKQKECDISIDVLFLADENEYSFLCVSPFSGVYIRIHGSDEPLNFTVAESFGDLQVHHITYERLGCHEIDDLITLCRPCHTKIHSIELARKQE